MPKATPPQGTRQARFSDDNQKLSSSFRALGCAWRHPINRVTPRKFRQSLLACCDPVEWSMGRTSQFSEDQIDMLLYALTGINPNTRTQDFGAQTKGELRDQVYGQHKRVMRQNPQRVQMLAENLENLMALVLRLGYPVDAFSPQLYQQYQQMMPGSVGLGVAPGSATVQPQHVVSDRAAESPRRLKDGSVVSPRPPAFRDRGTPKADERLSSTR